MASSAYLYRTLAPSDHTWQVSSTFLSLTLVLTLQLAGYLYLSVYLTLTPHTWMDGQLHLPSLTLILQAVPQRTRYTYLCLNPAPERANSTYLRSTLNPQAQDYIWKASSAHLPPRLAPQTTCAYLFLTLALQTIPGGPALPTCALAWFLALYLVGQLYLPMLDHGSSKHPGRLGSPTCFLPQVLTLYLVSQFNLPV